MISNYNECVQPDDVCIWVGDVTFTNTTETNLMLERMNGYKILVVGNHDFEKKKFRNLDFDEIWLAYFINSGDTQYVLTHYPMENAVAEPQFNIHGHSHTRNIADSRLHNVSVEQLGFKPVTLQSIINDINEGNIN